MLKILIAILLSCPVICSGQLTEKIYRRESLGGLCTRSICIFSDSSFSIEEGCEASSRISFGKWSQNKNMIKFTPISRNEFKLIDTVYSFEVPTSSVNIKIIDSSAKNVTEKLYIVQVSQDNKYYSLRYDTARKLKFDIRRANSVLRIVTFERLFGQSIVLDPVNSDYLEVHLTFSFKNIWNEFADWCNETEFILEKKSDRLVSVNSDFVDDFNKPPQKSQYLLVH